MKSRVLNAVSIAVIAGGLVIVVPGQATAESTPGGAYRNSAEDRATTARLNAEAKSVKVTADPKSPKLRALSGAAAALATGTYPTRAGTFMSTNSKASGVIPLGHSAMVYNSSYVVEANPSNGVAFGSNNWYYKTSGVWGMTVKATTASQDAYAASWASARRGKGYNWNFYDMGIRTKFYCSQLVWAAFRDTTGIDLNTGAYDVLGFSAIAPMEFPSSANSGKISTIYYKA